MAWRDDLRSADQECESGARRLALWHHADLPRVLRSADDPVPAEISVASAAFLRQLRDDEHLRRQRDCAVAGRRKVPAPRADYGLPRAVDDGGSRPPARRVESTGDRTSGRDAGP